MMPRTRERLLREDLNVRAIRARLQQRGIVEIPAILSPVRAERMHRFLARDMPQDWWSVSVVAGGEPEFFQDIPANRPRIQEAYQRARQELRNGHFSYCFRRTLGDHLAGCPCPECEFRAALADDEMLDFLARLGLGITAPGAMFASKYSRGSFLSPHHDCGNGRLAFVMNLSPSWQPQWGGLLMFLNDDWRTVRRVCTPSFNTLCLFGLPTEGTVPHLVTQVVTRHRLAFSGWYVAE